MVLSSQRIILQGEQLTRRFPVGRSYFEVLKGIDVSVRQGEFVAVMGPSGSGKTTLLQILGGLDRPTNGRVILDGVDLTRLSERELTLLRRQRTGFVFQAFNLVPTLTVYENIALPLLIAGKKIASAEERIAELLQHMHLVGLEEHRPDQLSAGEQQRVALARAILLEPAIVLADEPTGNLDYTSTQEVMRLLKESCEKFSQTIVLVTHDVQASAYADRVIVLRDGQVQDEIVLGRREETSAAPLISRLEKLGL